MRKVTLLTICLLWSGAGSGDWGGEASWARAPFSPRTVHIEGNFKGRVRLTNATFHRLPFRGRIYASSSHVRICFRRSGSRVTSCMYLKMRSYRRHHFRCWFPSRGAVCLRVPAPVVRHWLGAPVPPVSSVSMAQPKAYTRMIHARLRRHLSFPGTWPKREVMACVKTIKLGITLDARGRFLWKKVRFLGKASRPCLRRVLGSLQKASPFPKPWPKGRKSARLTLQKLGFTPQTGK